MVFLCIWGVQRVSNPPLLSNTGACTHRHWPLENCAWQLKDYCDKYIFLGFLPISVLYYLIQTWVINAKAIITTGQYSQQYNVCKTYFYMHNVFYCLLFLGLSPNFNFCYCSIPFIFTPSFLYFTFQFRVSWI